jgi:hypothetical protein
MKNVISSTFIEIYRQFFASEKQNKNQWIFWLWAALLFFGGAFLWGYFLQWGSPQSLLFQDWTDITLPRLAFLQNAFQHGVIPMHITDWAPLGEVTDRFLTIPDLLLSPQVLLLKWMDVGHFIMLNFWLSFAAGYAGLLWLSRKYHLSSAAFTVLAVLFNFNGHILSHFAIGHYTWTGYFLFPWLVGLILILFEEQVGWKWVTQIALLLFLIIIQGAYHQFIWSLFLLAFTIPILPKQFWRILEALVASVFLAAIRLIPPFLNLGKFDTIFYTGYPSVFSIWDAMVRIVLPSENQLNSDRTIHIGAWEYSLYIGLIGAVFLIIFGIIQLYRNRKSKDSFALLLAPVTGLVILSLDRVYKYLRIILPLPLLDGERVSTRIISLAFAILLILAVIEFQKWLDAHPKNIWMSVSYWGGLIFLVTDLWQNFDKWQVDFTRNLFEHESYNPLHWGVANHEDPSYLLAIQIGLAISLIALTTLLTLTYREKQNTSKSKTLR